MMMLRLLLLLALAAPLSAQTVVNTIDLPEDAGPYQVAVDETTNTIYVANSDGTLSIIDGASPVIETVVIGTRFLGAVALNETTNTIYVSEPGDGNVVVIDGATRTIVTRIAIGGRPFGLAVDESTNTIYAALQSAGAVAFIDGSTNTATLPTTGLGAEQPLSLAVNESTNRLYVAERDGQLNVVDATTGAVLDNPVVGDNLQWVALDEATNRIYVSDYRNDVVVVVDGVTNGVVTTIPVGVGPQGVGFDRVRQFVYVANEDDATVSVIDATTNAVVTTIEVGDGPFTSAPVGVGVNAATNRVYVATFLYDNVSVLGPVQATITTNLIVDTVADDQPYDATASRLDCTDGELDGDCTLREAILVANDNNGQEVPNLDTIGFEILDSFGAVDGVATISPSSELPAVEDDGVEIDGYTQPDSALGTATSEPVINVVLDGSSLTAGAGLTLQANGGLVRGLAVTNFPSHGIVIEGGGFGQGNTIAGNTIGVGAGGSPGPNGGHGVLVDNDFGNTIGGADPADANTIGANGLSGVSISGSGSSGNDVFGNYIGTNRIGADLGNTVYGIEVETPVVPGLSAAEADGLKTSSGTPANRLGGFEDGQGNTIGHNGDHGIFITNRPDGASILGNWIGTNAGGVAIGNGANGVQVDGTEPNSGTVFLRDNVIGNNTGQGVEVFLSSGVSIAENTIGTDMDGAPLGNGQSGIYVRNSTDISVRGNTIGDNASSGVAASATVNLRVTGNWIGTNAAGADIANTVAGVSLLGSVASSQIGGPDESASNTIANNGGAGIRLSATASTDNAILGNRIFGNGGLGIDLEGGTEDGFGVTENDRDDPDSGPNELQNYPAISAVVQTDTGADVSVELSTSAGGLYWIELFANDAADPSGFGEGARLVGSTFVQPNASGFASATLSIAGLDADDVITATATPTSEGGFGGTSEFSRAVRVVPTVRFAAPASASASEGDTVDLEVTLSAPAPAGGVTVEIELVEDENSATTPADLGGFTSQTETVTFAPGESTKTIAVTVTDDGAAEDAETFRFDLENATGAVIGQPSRFTLDVEASEQTVTITIASAELTAREGQTTSVAAALTTGDGAPLAENAAFTISQIDGSADNDDFAPFTTGAITFDGDFPETLTALAGTPSGTVFQIPVPLEDDGEVEGEEVALLEVTSDDAIVVNGDVALTIEDAPVVQFASAAYVAEEGDTVSIRVRLDQAAAGTESVDVVFTSGDPSGADSDDLDGFTSETVSFSSGDLEATVLVDIPRDGLTEGDEMFTFALQAATGLGIGDPSETVLTVALSVATVSLETPAYDVSEGDVVEVEVTLSDAARGGESVTIVLEDMSGPGATADDLGGFESTTVRFASGATSASFEVEVTRDGVAEGVERFTLVIEDADGLLVSVRDETEITVAPSRTSVEFADADFMVAEGSTATLTLVLGEPAAGGETVAVALVSMSPDGAEAADVGGFTTQTVTFAAGAASATVEVEITDDGRTEDAEAFTFALQTPMRLVVGTAALAVVTVDPSATTVSFATSEEVTVGEGAGTVEVEILFGEPLAEGGQFDVVLASSSDDASRAGEGVSQAGPDDLGGFESVTIEVDAGATSATLSLSVTDDSEAEGTERFEFEIRNATGGGPNGLALGDATLTLVIEDNDNPVADDGSEAEASTVGLAFPNPTSGPAWLELSVDVPQSVRVTVLDAVGRIVEVIDVTVSGIARVEVGAGLAPGTYIVQVVGPTVAGTRPLTVAR